MSTYITPYICRNSWKKFPLNCRNIGNILLGCHCHDIETPLLQEIHEILTCLSLKTLNYNPVTRHGNFLKKRELLEHSRFLMTNSEVQEQKKALVSNSKFKTKGEFQPKLNSPRGNWPQKYNYHISARNNLDKNLKDV